MPQTWQGAGGKIWTLSVGLGVTGEGRRQRSRGASKTGPGRRSRRGWPGHPELAGQGPSRPAPQTAPPTPGRRQAPGGGGWDRPGGEAGIPQDLPCRRPPHPRSRPRPPLRRRRGEARRRGGPARRRQHGGSADTRGPEQPGAALPSPAAGFGRAARNGSRVLLAGGGGGGGGGGI